MQMENVSPLAYFAAFCTRHFFACLHYNTYLDKFAFTYRNLFHAPCVACLLIYDFTCLMLSLLNYHPGDDDDDVTINVMMVSKK